MKALGRTLVILIAALVVVGVAYAALSAAGSGQPIGLGESIGRPTPADQSNSSNGLVGERIDRGPDRSGSFETVVSNLVIIVMIVFSVQGAWAIIRTVDKHYWGHS